MRDRPTVLAVDRNQTFLGTLAILLERLNFEVLPLTNAGDAIELARVARPQVMTLSMHMSDVDSLKLIRDLRADPELSDLPVIMISSTRDKQRVWEAMSLGCIEVLDTPLELNRLHQSLQRCNLYPGGRRRYLRAPYPRYVEVAHNGDARQLTGITISERGVMVRMPEPLPKGSPVEVGITFKEDDVRRFSGEVIYVRGGRTGTVAPPPGVAIKFDRLTIKDTEQLHELVKQLLIGDILATQTEPVIRQE